VGALAAAGLLAWSLTSRPPTPSILSYTVDGVSPSPDGYVRSSSTHEPELSFSDGTNIHMMSEARARVVDVGSRGARLVLEEGRAHVHVVHRPGADWQIQAGSFVVHVQGTAFFVTWNAAEARLDLQMENGVVSVDGPALADRVVLRAGQSLSARADGSSLVSPTQPGPRPAAPAGRGSETAPVEAAPPPAAPAAAPRPAAPRSAPSVAPPSLPWSERLADGDAERIVAEARRRGLATVLATASSEDLAALADAARFRMQERLARRVLLAQRARFPGTLRAKEASFLLGRLAEGHGAGAVDALAWYDRYLHEAPSGAYVAEAMGRMMIVLERQHRMDEARTVATEYLHRFPQGVYARAARAVTSP
jgi:TolA-binding protein